MALIIENTANYVGSVSQADHSATITVSTGTGRKIVVVGCVEIGASATLTATFDGSAMTERASAAHTAGTELKLYLWTYDIADGAGSGSKTVTVTTAVSGTAVSWFAWQLSGAATGAPEYASVTEASNSVSSISQSSVTVTSGAAIFAGGNNSSATPTYNTWAGVTERQENNESAYTTAFADSTANTSGTKTVSVTMSATSGNKLFGVISVAEAAAPSGLTITSVTPSSFDSGIAGIVIAGSGFGASQGSSTVDIGGQAQTVTAWGDTSITFTSVRGSVSPGNATLTLTKG